MFLKLLTVEMIVFLAPQCSMHGSSPVKFVPGASCPAASPPSRFCVHPDRDGRAPGRVGLRGEHPSRPPLGLGYPPLPPPAADSRRCGRVSAALLRRPSGWAAGEGPGRTRGRKAAWARRPFPRRTSLCAPGKPSKPRGVRTAESASAVVPGHPLVPFPAECGDWEADGGRRG